MEPIKLEIKQEQDEKVCFGEQISEESNIILKTEENTTMKTEDFIKTERNTPMKTENFLKPEDGQFIQTVFTTDVSSAIESNVTKDFLEVKLSRNDLENKIIKPEYLKTLVIKLDRIDKQFFADGFKVYKEDISSNNTDINQTFPIKPPDKFLDSKTGNYSDEESDVYINSVELNLNRASEDQEVFAGSTSANVQKKYVRPLKFVCTLCDKRFSSSTILSVHTRIHTGERPYCCSYCLKRFRTRTLFKLHLQQHTGKRHKCTQCSMAFAQVGPLNVHMRTHSGLKPFACSQCYKGFSSKTSLIKHFKTHCFSSKFVQKQVFAKCNGDARCDTSIHLYTCDICNKNFRQKSCLSDHIQHVHLKVQSFPCKICGMLSSTPSNRIKHERLHENKFQFVCHDCNKSFKEKGGLTIHLTLTHSDSKPFYCDLCNTSFKTQSNLNIHIEVHHAKKNPNKYVCDECNMGFYRLPYLKRHQKTHTGSDKTCICEDCGTKCRSKTDMERHVLTHIGGGDKPFKCDVCGAAFSRRNKMLRHKLVHSNEQPYKCDLCSKAYKDSSSLRIHKGSSHLKTKFICEKCGFKSMNESSFKRHVRHQMCKI